MDSELNWSAFYGELGRIGPGLLRGVPHALSSWVEAESRETDAFYSDALTRVMEVDSESPELAVQESLDQWAHNVRTYLDEFLGPGSLNPWVTSLPKIVRWRMQKSVANIRVVATNEAVLDLSAALMFGMTHAAAPANLMVQCVVDLVGSHKDGQIVRASAVPWRAVLKQLQRDWRTAYQIPSRKWEELIAAASDAEGYDEVVLTPRSGDFGRDVIAVKNGIGTVRVINSVKAYAPDRPVDQDDVRALMGVVAADHKASKGIVTTTSTFAPRMLDDPFIAAMVPFRIELMDGVALRRWLVELLRK